MSDSKGDYSAASVRLRDEAEGSGDDSELRRMYEKSMRRKERHGAKWLEVKVNLNELVEKYAPRAAGRRRNVKFIFQGERYSVVADMANGSVRIWDQNRRMHLDLAGNATKDERITHFKIKHRKEM